MSKDCPEPPKERGKRPMTCRNCGTLFLVIMKLRARRTLGQGLRGAKKIEKSKWALSLPKLRKGRSFC